MNGEKLRSAISLQAMYEAGGRRLEWWQVGANFIGACIVTSYFVFFDQVYAGMGIPNTFYVLGVLFPVLVLIARRFMGHWQKDLNLFLRLEAQNRKINVDLRKKAQHRILDLPYMSASISLFCWFLAAITMTTYSLISEPGTWKIPAGSLPCFIFRLI